MPKTKPKISRFDAAEYLDSNETIAEYLTAALEDPDPEIFIAALSDVVRAKGVAQIAEAAGLGRESLYKTLQPGAQPRFETIRKLVDALGIKLHADAA